MGDTHNELTGDVHGVVYQARTMNFFAERAAPALSGLPRPEPDFTGRTAELARLAEQLRPGQDERAVVVSAVAGLGGVGKTTLAVKAAHDAVAAGWFPGGVLFLNLHGYSPEGRVQPADALATLLRDLGAPVPPNLAGRESLYRTELARRTEPMLILLDNASSSDQVLPLLPNSRVHRVLVTSRHSLGDLGATPIDLNVLDEADTAKLVENSLRTRLPDDRRVRDDPAAVALLGELCGHLPLALGIATSMLADDPEMPISELVDALRGETTRLKELVYGENHAVRATFDLSFHRLTEAQQRMFALLALHPGKQVGVRSAAALAGVTEREARRTLDDLRRAHVVLSGKPRGWFRFHDLVRLYAVDHARRLPDRDDAVERLLENYYDTVYSAQLWVIDDEGKSDTFSGIRDVFTWFESEMSSLRAIVDLAAKTLHDREAVMIPLLITHIWTTTGADEDLVHMHRIGLDVARRAGNSFKEMGVRLSLSRTFRSLGRIDEAAVEVDLARALTVEHDWPEFTLRCDIELGWVRMAQHRYRDAVEVLERGLAAAAEFPSIEPLVLRPLADAHTYLDELPRAREHVLRALDVYQRSSLSIDYAHLLGVLADIEGKLGDTAAALESHARALLIHERLEYANGQDVTLRRLAEIHAARKEHDVEARYLERRAALLTGASEERADALRAWGSSLVNAGRHAEAAEQLRAAVALYAELKQRRGEALSFDWLSSAEYSLGNYSVAEEAARKAVTLFRELGDGWVPESRWLAEILRDAGKTDEAEQLLQDLLRHHEAEADARAQADDLRHLAYVSNARRDHGAAAGRFEQAAALFEAVDDQQALMETLISGCNAFSNAGNHPAALEAARKGLALARTLGATDQIGLGLLRLGRALNGVGENRAALEPLTEALPLYAGNAHESTVRYHLGLAHRELREFPSAREHLLMGLALDQGESSRFDEGMTLHQLGLLHRDEGDLVEARRLGEQAFAMLTEAGHTEHAARTRAWLDGL
ncbi:tetratricopeptide repeat protein [Lentzea tibetensis]|uniref:tetratricopeptide repeat protein n=1 Tax=Lentzea tibetensis TaxID=2591470 RepID=UPI001646F486|nr:tetratricopeptide repeat protein [Lentzea tibetensis]